MICYVSLLGPALKPQIFVTGRVEISCLSITSNFIHFQLFCCNVMGINFQNTSVKWHAYTHTHTQTEEEEEEELAITTMENGKN